MNNKYIFYYRWNPFKNRWEYRQNTGSYESTEWKRSVANCDATIELELPKSNKTYTVKELFYIDTWCELIDDEIHE